MLLEDLKPDISVFLDTKNIEHSVLNIYRKGSHQCITDNTNIFIKVNRARLPAQNALNASININNPKVKALETTILAYPNNYYLTIWNYLTCVDADLNDEKFIKTSIHNINTIHQTEAKFDYPNGNLLEEVLKKRIERIQDEELRKNLNKIVKEYVSPIYQKKQKNIVTHGDAHLKNLVSVDGEPVWIDYEQVKLAPREWDIACIVVDLLKKNPKLVDPVIKEFNNISPIDQSLLDSLIFGRKISIATHIANRNPESTWKEIKNMLSLE